MEDVTAKAYRELDKMVQRDKTLRSLYLSTKKDRKAKKLKRLNKQRGRKS